MGRFKFLLFLSFYLLLLIGVTIYSYTQVDLNLTINSDKKIFEFQQLLQAIGYYNRTLSGILYLFLVLCLTVCYSLIIFLTISNRLNLKQIIVFLFFTVIILIFSYPAFSHDLFNYLFDARIFTKYGLNPYEYKALDFPLDPWIRFMHWTHRQYPYGPVWLLISLPFSFLGQQKFFLTLFLFKILGALSYLMCIYFIYRISKTLSYPNPVIFLVFFAFNPLVLIEGLVSSHNDLFMTGLLLAGIYYLLNKKYLWSLLFLFLSIGIKFGTIVFLPIWFYLFIKKKTDIRFNFNNLLVFYNLCVTLLLIFYLWNHPLQPWYFLWIYPTLLLLNTPSLTASFIILSTGLAFSYTPYLFTGSWTEKVLFDKNLIILVSFFISLLFFILNKKFFINRTNFK